MEQFQFKFTDIFRVSRYGFSGRRIGIHLTGILLSYLIYEILVYLSLFIKNADEVKKFWNSYGLLPIPPFVTAEFNTPTTVAMWIGIFCFALIFFLASTMASKITIEQLRGDVFFSVGDALSFLKQKWKTVFGAFFGLLFILFFLLLIPIGIALLGKIPALGKPILVLGSLFTPIAFVLGLLIAFITIVFLSSLFFVPAIVATTNADAFETIFQLFSIVWNEPWRLIGYGTLLFVLKLGLVPIWAIFCLGGFLIVLLPMYFLHESYIQGVLGNVNRWSGEALQKISSFFTDDSSSIFDINTSQTSMTVPIIICAILITLTLICIAGIIVAYLFSLASVGTTSIYTIIRKRLDGQSLIETIGTVASVEPPPLLIGDE